MPRDHWEEAITRAVVERQFRARLLADPAGTLFDYGLSWDEMDALDSVRVETLDQLTVQLRRLSSHRWKTFAA